jgi:transcription elongation factor GreA
MENCAVLESDIIWLSKAAYDRLTQELEHLRTVERPRASERIGIARSHGDIRENAEYDVAKDEQGKIEARIRQLEATLRVAKVGEAPSGNQIAAGMVVTTVDADGVEETFLLGSREDRPQGLAVYSAQSPLGKALLGHTVGETVSYQAPAGMFKLTITGVRPLEG